MLYVPPGISFTGPPDGLERAFHILLACDSGKSCFGRRERRWDASSESEGVRGSDIGVSGDGGGRAEDGSLGDEVDIVEDTSFEELDNIERHCRVPWMAL